MSKTRKNVKKSCSTFNLNYTIKIQSVLFGIQSIIIIMIPRHLLYIKPPQSVLTTIIIYIEYIILYTWNIPTTFADDIFAFIIYKSMTVWGTTCIYACVENIQYFPTFSPKAKYYAKVQHFLLLSIHTKRIRSSYKNISNLSSKTGIVGQGNILVSFFYTIFLKVHPVFVPEILE